MAHIIGGAPDSVLEAIGLPADLVARLKADYRRDGKTAAAVHVTEECLDAFTIVGDAALCIDRIQALEEAGATQFIFLMPPGAVDGYSPLINRLAETVIPAFR